MISKSAKAKLKSTLFSISRHPLAKSAFSFLPASKGVIFCFHRVLPTYNESENFPGNDYVISVKSFELLLALLSDQFTCVDLDTFLLSDKKRGVKPLCHITFDDGYLDNLEIAMPLLRKYDLPATIYVTSGYIAKTIIPSHHYMYKLFNLHHGNLIESAISKFDLQKRFKGIEIHRGNIASLVSQISIKQQNKLCNYLISRTGLKPDWDIFLTPSQLKLLSSEKLITIGSHSVSHPNLVKEDFQTIKNELCLSKQLLEDILGQKVLHFAYPYGGRNQISKQIVQQVGQAGYRSAVTTMTRSYAGNRKFLVPRLFVTNKWTEESILARSLGLAWLLNKQLAL